MDDRDHDRKWFKMRVWSALWKNFFPIIQSKQLSSEHLPLMISSTTESSLALKFLISKKKIKYAQAQIYTLFCLSLQGKHTVWASWYYQDIFFYLIFFKSRALWRALCSHFLLNIYTRRLILIVGITKFPVLPACLINIKQFSCSTTAVPLPVRRYFI